MPWSIQHKRKYNREWMRKDRLKKGFEPRGSKEHSFWKKVRKTENCWLWCSYITKGGYGQITFNYKKEYAHRYSYELHKGKIPKGLHIDHLCRVRHCVNPGHLEVVTCKENLLRGDNWNRKKTHCKNGHEFTEKNTRLRKSGGRNCRKCHIKYSRKYSEKVKNGKVWE